LQKEGLQRNYQRIKFIPIPPVQIKKARSKIL